MIKQIKTYARSLTTATASLLLAFFCGCEKKPDVPVSRAQDPVYRARLESLRSEQAAVASRRAKVTAQLDALRRRAQAVVGENASEEQIEAEFAAHPEKYVGLKELKQRAAECADAMKGSLEKARATVRDRILKEEADRKDAAAAK